MALGNNLTKKDKDKSLKNAPLTVKHDKTRRIERVNILSSILEEQKQSLSDENEIDEPSSLYINFKVAEENYAMPINLIDEVVPRNEISIIPQVPNFILGLVNVRGEVYTLIDLGLKHKLRKADDIFSPNFFITIKSDDFKIAIATEQLPLTIIVKDSELSKTDSLSQDENNQNNIGAIIKQENNMLMCIEMNNLINDLIL